MGRMGLPAAGGGGEEVDAVGTTLPAEGGGRRRRDCGQRGRRGVVRCGEHERGTREW